MTNLLWPGDHLAGTHFTDESLLAAMVAVEDAWLAALVAAGVAPASTAAPLGSLVGTADVEAIAVAAADGGNPVIPLVSLLRERSAGDAATWLHRGLTSQDVLDTALVLCARDALRAIADDLAAQLASLADLAVTHRATPMVARTLTQHAVPTTFGARVAGWIDALLAADDEVTRALAGLRPQFGGAAGTLSALVELGGPEVAADVVQEAASTLGLPASAPWHVSRATLTRIGDTLTTCTDAWGHVAADVLLAARPEVGELAEAGGGGSSTMPHKSNPVLSVLIRRAALASPALASTLHLAAADAHEERSAGAWHVEWDTLRTLGRRAVVAAAQATALLHGLRVNPHRMASNLAAAEGTRAEQEVMANLAGHAPGDEYLGLATQLAVRAAGRAAQRIDERRTNA